MATVSIDINDNWTRLSLPGDTDDLSEYEFGGDGGTIGASVSIELSPVAGGAWLQSPREDLEFEVVLTDGRINRFSVDYTGGPAGGLSLAT